MQIDDDVEYIKNEYEFTIVYKNKGFFKKLKQNYHSFTPEPLSFDEQLQLDYQKLIAQMTGPTPLKEKDSALLAKKSMLYAVLLGSRLGTASFQDVLDVISQTSQFSQLNFFNDVRKYIQQAIELQEVSQTDKERLKLLYQIQIQLNDLTAKKSNTASLLYSAKQLLEGTIKQEDLAQTMNCFSCEKKTLKLLSQVLAFVQQDKIINVPSLND